MAASKSPAGKVTPLRKRLPCPICGKPSGRPDFPFCSQRCKTIDLNNWLSGSYAIPVSEADENTDGEKDE